MACMSSMHACMSPMHVWVLHISFFFQFLWFEFERELENVGSCKPVAEVVVGDK